ncbi:MAG TPA: trypsin-like peptidase domain-containing protein [Candidatus Limnocylindrales bacterium]|nr:trypsin-like peptidase domain-containing protein [Candidatus Limnocylindrales bacterium]
MTDPYNSAPSGSTDETRTTSYTPPVEPRTSWSGQGWPQQTPPHWFEPLPGQQQPPKRRGSSVAVLFVVALIASVVGSGLTYMAMSATNRANLAANAPATPSPLLGPSATPGQATDDDPSAVTRAAEAVSPAVVTITVREGEATDPFSLPETGVGSGLIYDSNGWVLTNRHVVADATVVTVEMNDGQRLEGSVYGVDTLTDLAIVKIEGSDLPSAPIGDSSTLQPGQTAIAIGSPLGTFTNSVTSGVISATGRQLSVTDPVTNERRSLRNLIQTDAAINPGNSGGPLVDETGSVIGVSTAFAEGAQGIFFAIPINIAKPIMRQAIAGEELTRPWIGIVYVAVDRNLATENDLPIDYGAWISPETANGAPPIVEGSPAQDAGLMPGDIVTAIDGRRIDASQGLDDVLSLYGPGDMLTLSVLRDGETIEVEVTLGTRPAGLD